MVAVDACGETKEGWHCGLTSYRSPESLSRQGEAVTGFTAGIHNRRITIQHAQSMHNGWVTMGGHGIFDLYRPPPPDMVCNLEKYRSRT